MSHRTLAALTIPAALILPLAVPGVAEAVPTVTATHAAASTAAHSRHLTHLHHLHVLHLRVLAARKTATSERTRVINAARSAVGRPYVYGAAGPHSFDCSGLTQWAYALAGKHLPRTAAAQGRVGRQTTRPRPGDLVVWSSRGVAYHVGVYIGRARAVVARHVGTLVGIEVINWGHPTYRVVLT